MELKDGEVICPECDGTGGEGREWCMYCHGDGKLDWIEAAVGKKGISVWGQKTLKSFPDTIGNGLIAKKTAIQIILNVEEAMKDII